MGFLPYIRSSALRNRHQETGWGTPERRNENGARRGWEIHCGAGPPSGKGGGGRRGGVGGVPSNRAVFKPAHRGLAPVRNGPTTVPHHPQMLAGSSPREHGLRSDTLDSEHGRWAVRLPAAGQRSGTFSRPPQLQTLHQNRSASMRQELQGATAPRWPSASEGWLTGSC